MKMGFALYFFGGCDMVYLLKFGASWVLPPGIFILALFVLSWWLLKKRAQKTVYHALSRHAHQQRQLKHLQHLLMPQ